MISFLDHIYKVDDWDQVYQSELLWTFRSNIIYLSTISLKVLLSRQSVYLCMIMQSHAANASRQFLERKGISGEKLIILPPARPDLTPYGISSWRKNEDKDLCWWQAV